MTGQNQILSHSLFIDLTAAFATVDPLFHARRPSFEVCLMSVPFDAAAAIDPFPFRRSNLIQSLLGATMGKVAFVMSSAYPIPFTPTFIYQN